MAMGEIIAQEYRNIAIKNTAPKAIQEAPHGMGYDI
jgi:hypothetical protein